MYVAMKSVLDAGKHVVMTTQPYKVGMTLASDGSQTTAAGVHKAQQEQLKTFLAARFGGNARLHFVNLGDAVDLKDPALSYDTMHLTARGNQVLASVLAPQIAPLVK